jgi:hypothetical protein
VLVLVLVLGSCRGLSLLDPLGAQCELTSECDAPLVCRIGFCRNECATSRDCGAGLVCLLDNQGLGACQLPDERSCDRDSDCPDILVCRMSQCTNECNCPDGEVPCADCVPGAACVTDTASSMRGCVDSARSCVWDTDCPTGTVCLDERCRPECRVQADCRSGLSCVLGVFSTDPFAPDGGTATACVCGLVDPPGGGGPLALCDAPP